MSKSYLGRRTDRQCYVSVVTDGNLLTAHPLPLRLDLWNHSPTGFEWGYSGSGPGQLALALLADALGDGEAAREMHQRFKRQVVGRFNRTTWTLTQDEVLAWVADHLAGSWD